MNTLLGLNKLFQPIAFVFFSNVTDAIRTEFNLILGRQSQWTREAQTLNILAGKDPGETLYQFKTALSSLGYIPSRKGDAWYHRLWAIALNATDGNIENTVKKVWKTRHGIGRMNATHQSNFATWYAAL